MNFRRLNDIALKWKLIIPFLFLAIAGASSLFVISYKFQDSLIHVNEAKRLKNQYRFFLNDVEFKKNMAMSLASLTAKNCDVAEAFAQRDRERLIELLEPAYKALHNDFDVQQFHFHTEHATSFLRLHALDNLECCGEVMESFRPDIMQAFETCKACGGIEKGTFGLSIRGVVPVFYLENLVGTVEIGLSIGLPFLNKFKKHYGSDVILHVEDEPGSNKLKVLSSTVEEGVLSSDLLTQCFVSGETVLQAGTLNGHTVVVMAGPVYDFSSNRIAVVEIILDRSPTLVLLRHYAVIAAAIALSGLILSVSFIWFISVLFTKRIGEVAISAEEIAAGSRNMRIEVQSRDELGCMTLAINQMLISLEVSRHKLSEYARDLEIMVDERTQSLKESERTYRTLVENVPITVYMTMADGTTVFLNRFVEQMIGVTPRQLNGKHQLWDAHIHHRDRARVIAEREECLRNGKAFHIDYRMIHKDGHVAYVIDQAVAVFDNGGEFLRMDGIIVDVTVQKQLHEEHLQSEELQTLSQISSRLAHELRNPLTTIGGLTRRIQKTFKETDPRIKKAVLIIEQVEKLEKILQMMMGYLGTQTVTLASVDLNAAVSEAVEKIKTTVVSKDFSVAVNLDENLHNIQLDREQFINCLVLLIENAFYRMGLKGAIDVKTKRSVEHATVTLSYRVPNITDDDIHDFFYPFTVAYPFMNEDFNNDILDVPVCKRIIHNHCGIINVSREDNDVLWIDISFPLER